jgi:hypothetical protein
MLTYAVAVCLSAHSGASRGARDSHAPALRGVKIFAAIPSLHRRPVQPSFFVLHHNRALRPWCWRTQAVRQAGAPAARGDPAVPPAARREPCIPRGSCSRQWPPPRFRAVIIARRISTYSEVAKSALPAAAPRCDFVNPRPVAAGPPRASHPPLAHPPSRFPLPAPPSPHSLLSSSVRPSSLHRSGCRVLRDVAPLRGGFVGPRHGGDGGQHDRRDEECDLLRPEEEQARDARRPRWRCALAPRPREGL